MSRWDESYEDRRAREHEERRKYDGDVVYEAWRRGLNSDRAADCADDCYYAGRSPEECVDGLARRERAAREHRQEQERQEADYLYQQEQEYYAQQQQEQQPEPSAPADDRNKE